MTKVIKKHIKKAVLIYEDPDLHESRRVVFGDPLQVFHLLMSQMPILLERMEKISGKKFKNSIDMITYYLSHKEDWSTIHGIEASNGDMEMNLTYEVKKLV